MSKIAYAIFAAGIAITLGGCVTTERQTRLTVDHIKLSSSQNHAIKTGVLQSLKDPSSAMFGPIVASREPTKPNKTYVCGTVNARNSFGGYAGAKMFYGVLTGSDFMPVLWGGTDDEDYMVAQMCLRVGL